MKELGEGLYLIFCVATAMIAYHITHDECDAILAFLFAPLYWVYWLVTHQINLTIIKETFAFFLK